MTATAATRNLDRLARSKHNTTTPGWLPTSTGRMLEHREAIRHVTAVAEGTAMTRTEWTICKGLSRWDGQHPKDFGTIAARGWPAPYYYSLFQAQIREERWFLHLVMRLSMPRGG